MFDVPKMKATIRAGCESRVYVLRCRAGGATDRASEFFIHAIYGGFEGGS